MNYLLLETSGVQTSEYVFWHDVLKFSGLIVSAGGNHNIVSILLSILKTGCICGNRLNSDDKIYVFYDSLNMFRDFSLHKDIVGYSLVTAVITHCEAVRNMFGCRVFIANDFCFESLFLRSSVVYNIVESGLGRVKEYDYTCLERHAKSNMLYNRSVKNFVCDMYNLKLDLKLAGDTPESVAYSWLNCLLGNRSFRVLKKDLGVCWHTDCTDLKCDVTNKGLKGCRLCRETNINKANILLKSLNVKDLESLFSELC